MMSTNARFALATLLAAAGTTIAQPYNRVVGQTEAEFAESVTVSSSMDLIFAGNRYGFSDFEQQVYVARTLADGTPVWDLTFGLGDTPEEAFVVRESPAGSILVGFSAQSPTFPDEGLCLAAVAPTGTLLWTERYEGYGASGLGRGMEIDGDAVVIANQFASGGKFKGAFNRGQLLRAASTDGALIFNYAYSADPLLAADVTFADVALLPDGDYFVTGQINMLYDGASQDPDILVARIDRTGTPGWCRSYTVVGVTEHAYEFGTSIALTADGHVAVVGRTDDPQNQFAPACAVHMLLDPVTGDVQATNLLSDIQLASASLHRISTGELVASGSRIFGDGGAAAQMWLIDPVTLNFLWRNEYGPGRTFAGDAVEHATGVQNLVLTGNASTFNLGPPLGYYDVLNIRTDMLGDDHCSAGLWPADPQPLTIATVAVTLTHSARFLATAFSPPAISGTAATARMCTPPCRADFNGDGFVDFFDYLDFIDAYSNGDAAADFNLDSSIDFFDYLDFVDAFAAGC